MAEQLTLGELIAALSAADQDLIVPAGFDSPHSYRGSYYELAFEPAGDVTVAAMLASAHAADGAEYEGWKGGDFTMTRDTLCHIAYEGCCGDEDGLTRERLEEMLAAGRKPERAADRVESLIASTMDEIESIGERAPERSRCGVPCLKHDHACDRSPGHTWPHRDVQQKGAHSCEWDTPGPDDVPALLRMVERLRGELEAAATVYRAEVAHTQRLREAAVGTAFETGRILGQLKQVETDRDRLRSQLAMHLTAWRHASRRARASRALRKAITADRDRLLEVGAATVATWRERAEKAEADRDRLAAELDEVRKGKVEQMLGRLGDWGEIGDYVRKIEAQRARYRLAWESARRGRAEARAEVKALEETVAAADAERDRLAERMAIAEEFVAARAEYITSINNCHPDNYADYHRWQGHAEGRRQLAQELGLPVAWPPEYERDATEPGA